MKCQLYKWWLYIFPWYLVCPVFAAENNTKQLQNIMQQITSVKTNLMQNTKQQSIVKEQIQGVNKKHVTISAKLNTTNTIMKHHKKDLAQITKRHTKQQHHLHTIKNALIKQIIAAYQVEQSAVLKNLLTKNKIISNNMLAGYHRYLMLALIEALHSSLTHLKTLESNKSNIAQRTKYLEHLEKKQDKQKIILEQTQKQHARALNKLVDNMTRQSRKLQQLLTAKHKLESFLDTLEPITQMTRLPKSNSLFCKHFTWPTAGNVTTHFGSSIENSNWQWNGIVITAPYQQKVRAIAAGKVVYASWFAGYGLLFIVDHKNGYISLYGYNHALHKKVHDNVASGEVIASVGKSDNNGTGLYFGIRYNGKPINPERLCS